jgi:hypothetical protein
MLVSSLLGTAYPEVTCLCSCKTSWCSSRHCSYVLLIPEIAYLCSCKTFCCSSRHCSSFMYCLFLKLCVFSLVRPLDAHVRPLDARLVIAHVVCLCSCTTSWFSSRHCSYVLLIPEVACLCSCKNSWCSSRHCSYVLLIPDVACLCSCKTSWFSSHHMLICTAYAWRYVLRVSAHVRPLDARLVIAHM